jgi:hypothetical protein
MLAYKLIKKHKQKKQASQNAEQVEMPSASAASEAPTLENKDATNDVSQPEVIAVTPIVEQTDPSTPPARKDSEPQITRDEKLAARRYRILLIIGLFFPFALQALDVTIIASALPWIASDFRGDKSFSNQYYASLTVAQTRSPR